MKTAGIFDWLEKHSRIVQALALCAIALMIPAVYGLVYATGGIRYVFSHSMYLPIVLASAIFGARIGVLTAVIAGAVLGPFMPIDTGTGEMQSTVNWLYRMGFFSLIALVTGIAGDSARAYLRHVRWMADHDEATRLPNRQAMIKRISRLRPLDPAGEKVHAVLVAELSNSREISTHFGYSALDEIMRQFAARMANHMPGSIRFYRLQDNQLAVLHVKTTQEKLAENASLLRAAFRETFQIQEFALHGDVFLGVAVFHEPGTEPGSRISAAVAAAEESIRSRSTQPVTVVAEAGVGQARENLELLGELKQALEQQQLTMHYQPKVEMSTGRIIGAEALMRWVHPTRGNIPPGKFIPRAENSTLIDQITWFAIERALQQIKQWHQAGLPELNIAVNISPNNLNDESFVEKVSELLSRYQVDGRYLEFELTERSFIENMDAVRRELSGLTQLNILLSIDDFGTGYSSLQYLERLPASAIKVDQSFIRNLRADSGAAEIVRAAVRLAHGMKMQVVAEGVETAECYQFLRSLGCDFAQGYHIARPMPAEEFTALVNGHQGIIPVATETPETPDPAEQAPAAHL